MTGTKQDIMYFTAERMASTWEVAQFFAYDQLGEDVQGISRACHDLAMQMIEWLPDSPELTVGLRKLLEAKDCFVRAGLD